jgi:hypothetical protein
MNNIIKLFITLLLMTFISPLAFTQDYDEQPVAVDTSIEEQFAQIQRQLDQINSRGVIRFSGEAKTGLYWRASQDDGRPINEYLHLHSMDDAGGEQQQGRFRLNMEYENPHGFGFKARIQWQNWQDVLPESWSYAFGYGNFFDNQLTVSVGKLGGSPWGTGGPELWKDLETVDKSGGMRVEFKPSLPQQYGRLNVGFVLNYFNSDRDQGWHADRPITIWYILQESLLGLAYTHDFFHFRFAYKFDHEYDAIQENKQTGGKGEDEIVYRVEEYILNRYVPGLKFWALGHLFGITADHDAITLYRNYAFVEYEPPLLFNLPRPFTAQLRFGYDYTPNRSVLHIKPSFYWNLFDKMVSIGSAFWYGQDFGVKFTEGSPYAFIEVEPKIQFNFSSSYIALVYQWRSEYFHSHLAHVDPNTGREFDPIRQTQKINLRFCIYY